MFPQTSNAGSTNREPDNIEHGTREEGTHEHRMREGCQGPATGKKSSVRLFNHFITYIEVAELYKKQFCSFLPSLPPDLYPVVTFLPRWNLALPGLLGHHTLKIVMLLFSAFAIEFVVLIASNPSSIRFGNA